MRDEPGNPIWLYPGYLIRQWGGVWVCGWGGASPSIHCNAYTTNILFMGAPPPGSCPPPLPPRAHALLTSAPRSHALTRSPPGLMPS